MHQRQRAVAAEAQLALAPENAVSRPGEVAGSNVDRVLYKNLVEIVPLVETLMDRRGNPSYSRRASMVYTPVPTQTKKPSDMRVGKSASSASAKKKRILGDNGNGLSVTSTSVAESAQRDKKELCDLQSQLEELQKQLLEKEESLRCAESSNRQLNAASATIDELKHQMAEKDAFIKSASLELNNTKIMLADKQASLEKLGWEVEMLNKRNGDLEGVIASMDFERSALMIFFDKLLAMESSGCVSDNSAVDYEVEPIHLQSAIDDLDVKTVEKEAAAYCAAICTVRADPDEDKFETARDARLRLQAVVL